MKRWWAMVAKDYLTFSKKERTAIFLLLPLIIAIYFAPVLFKKEETPTPDTAFKQELSRLKISVDSNKQSRNFRNADENFDYYQPKEYAFEKTPKGELFEFDPNTIDASGWKRLGVRDKTIITITNFLSKGYKFRKAEDIKKIYGLRPQDADRLIPYVRIEETYTPTFASSTTPALRPAFETRPASTSRIIEVNSADTTSFIALPGIGSKLAARIVNFRDKLGGFASVDQVGETYGVPDSTFQKIKPLLACNPASLKRIDINNADINELRTHPYIKWNIATAIVNYRKQHGNYASLADLKKINIITDELFDKIAPYLKVL